MMLVERTFRLSLAALTAAMFLGCGGVDMESEAAADTDIGAPAAARTWALWEPMDSFNTSVWNKANWTNGGMFNCGWKPDHAYHSGGKLVLKLDNVSSHGKPYTSGEYRTNETFGYGTFETNMMAARGSGTVTSFFLYTGNPWDEIDVEILGKNTTQMQVNYFVNGQGGHEKVINLGFDAASGFHRYAIEWGPGWINWYVDGAWKWGVNNTGLNVPYGSPMPSHPMQIMVNLWPGIGVDSWLGRFNYTGPLYAQYDYVKFTPR
jgi:beta-glucanase (GH16 family)